MSQAFTMRIRVRLDDVDFAQVLYYPRVVHFCCVALEDFFALKLGLPWAQMLTTHHLAMPTVDLHVTYRRPLRFGDEADVEVRVKEVGNRTATFEFQMRHAESQEVTADVTHVVVFVDGKTWAAIPIPQPYRSALEEHLM